MKKLIKISTNSNVVLFSGEYTTKKQCLEAAVKQGIDLTNANLSDLDLTNTDLTNVKLVNAYFAGSDLTDADFSGSDISDAEFWGCKMKGIKLDNTTINFFKD